MLNHFIISYAGNKKNEFDELNNFLLDKLDNVDTIIEPYCGTSAISCLLSQKYPKRFKYIINDMDDNLIALYKMMNDECELIKFTKLFNEKVNIINNKQTYLEQINDNTLMGWFIKHKIFTLRPGLYPLTRKFKFNYNFDALPIIRFLRTEDITIMCSDGLELFKQYNDNEKCLIIADPPYILSCNDFYTYKSTNIYEYCADNPIKKMKAGIVFILEENWILRIIFKGCMKQSYDKTYKTKHTKTKHIIISNLD